MQFFNLSLISMLTMTISAAPAMTSTITTATPTRITTSTETVLVKQGTILDKAVDQPRDLSPGQKAGVAIGGAALGAGVLYGGYKAIKHLKTPKQATSYQSEDGAWNSTPYAVL